jgi:membrane protein implicated in regulation of membrane protease activity
MTDWMIWLALAGVVIVLEMFTGTFYLLMLGIGLTAGALVALAGAAIPWQFATAALVGLFATLALRRSRFGTMHGPEAARDPNVNLDIGQEITVASWTTVQGASTARAVYRGALWDVDLAPGDIAQPGIFIIREVKGNRFIVASKSGRPGHT